MTQFDDHGLQDGAWRGTLTGDRPARLAVIHLGQVVAEIAPDSDTVALPVPARALSSGLQTLLLMGDNGAPGEPLRADAQQLGHLAILAGQPLEQDALAEIASLRAELDLMKREFRRFAAERNGEQG
ncbi:hypothetical protein [Paracoccus sp. (in: a-proteobacteria)]|uniref:hypothetical protein n=1 Tax=Paracoccus sp. TaxID=267 RepID=UPI0026E0BE28|nr:hypothetical protein [Paracoccus sp. (in: a-proteobacteria)]MDO5647059.1 hypothetical protein [Paracoccus sp. (in: a-proteobacteria)]